LTYKQREIYSGDFSNTFGLIHAPKLILISKTVAEISEKHKIGKILDIASGDGLVAKEIETSTKAEVIGCDVSPVCVGKARKKNLQVILTDLNRGVPIRDETFDMVTAFDVLEHIGELDSLQKEIRRVLKPGGFLILTTPNLSSLIERLFLLLGFQPLGVEVSQYRKFGTISHRGKDRPVGHVRTLTLKALKEFLSFYKFNNIQVKTCPLNTAYPSLNLIDNSIGRLFPSFSNELLIVCEKSTGSLEVE
jgi:2-polyprenyl-3-methyl-5-hydroxy-6-metoxy-1,4-benzoquinol methylase